MTLGELIYKRRRTLGISQKALAQALGTSTGFVSQLERDLAAPSFQTLTALVHILSLDPELVFYPAECGDGGTPLQKECVRLIAHLTLPQQQAALEILRVLAKDKFES